MTDWFARPVLHVTDVDASIRFYVDRLGFSSPWRFEEDGKTFVAQVERQGCALILSSQWPEKVGKGLMFISLNVEPETHEAAVAALDALRTELEAKGAPVKDGRWGYRLLVVDDTDGNQLFFTIRTRLHPARLLEMKRNRPPRQHGSALHHQNLLVIRGNMAYGPTRDIFGGLRRLLASLAKNVIRFCFLRDRFRGVP